MQLPTYDFAKFSKIFNQIENISGRKGGVNVNCNELIHPVGLEMRHSAGRAPTALTIYRSAQSHIDHCAHIDLFILGWKDEETKPDQVVIESQRKTNHPETVANKPTDFCTTCLRDTSKRTNLINVGSHEMRTIVSHSQYVWERSGK